MDVFLIFYFVPFNLPNLPKIQNFKKMKKTPGDIFSLHKCTKNHDHMLYCSCNTMCDRCNCCFSFLSIFCLFTPPPPPNSPKNQNEKEIKKKHLEIFIYPLSFYMSVPKIMIRWCTVPEIWCTTDRWADRWANRRTDGKSDI